MSLEGAGQRGVGDFEDKQSANYIPGSQDPRDQHYVFRELASQLDRILECLQGDSSQDPTCQAITKTMKGKLLQFVTQPQVDQGMGNGDAHSGGGDAVTVHSPKRSMGKKNSQRRRIYQSAQGSSSDSSTSVASHVSIRNDHSQASLLQALQSLDSRKAAKPDGYDASSGKRLEDFFREFETYCSQTFRGPTSTWIGELGRLLQGEAAQAFHAYRGHRDSYEQVKEKLLQWDRGEKERRQLKFKAMFNKATRQSNEPIRFYAPRLENLYKQAYPNRNPRKSDTLLEKFLSSIPSVYRRHVKSAQAYGEVTGQGKLTWSQIVSLVAGIEVAQTENETDVEMVTVSADSSLVPRVNGEWTPVSAMAHSYQYEPHMNNNNIRSRTFYPNSTPVLQTSQSQQGTNHQRSHVLGNQNNRTANQVRCTYCQLVGHNRNQCRRLHGLCLACGDSDHRVQHCHFRLRNQQQNYTRNVAENQARSDYRRFSSRTSSPRVRFATSSTQTQVCSDSELELSDRRLQRTASRNDNNIIPSRMSNGAQQTDTEAAALN